MTVPDAILELVILVIVLIRNQSARDAPQQLFGCQLDSCIHGVCDSFDNGSYQCFCENGYTGYRCETNFNDCVSQPCQNGASCFDEVASVICSCTYGFTGKWLWDTIKQFAFFLILRWSYQKASWSTAWNLKAAEFFLMILVHTTRPGIPTDDLYANLLRYNTFHCDYIQWWYWN